jgi:hypothetical protein
MTFSQDQRLSERLFQCALIDNTSNSVPRRREKPGEVIRLAAGSFRNLFIFNPFQKKIPFRILIRSQFPEFSMFILRMEDDRIQKSNA